MPNVLQFLTDEDYKAKVAHPTLASLVKVWEDHIGSDKGKRNVKLPAFDLTPSQKYHFGKLVMSARLGVPIDQPIKARRVEVEVA